MDGVGRGRERTSEGGIVKMRGGVEARGREGGRVGGGHVWWRGDRQAGPCVVEVGGPGGWGRLRGEWTQWEAGSSSMQERGHHTGDSVAACPRWWARWQRKVLNGSTQHSTSVPPADRRQQQHDHHQPRLPPPRTKSLRRQQQQRPPQPPSLGGGSSGSSSGSSSGGGASSSQSPLT